MYHTSNGSSWMKENRSKKRKAVAEPVMDESEEQGFPLPLVLPKLGFGGSSSVYTHQNHIFFNDDITNETVFALNKELRTADTKQKIVSLTHGTTPSPIYLHLTTDGGSIHAAFSVVDCINSLSVPVYTVVDGFVASAGTLISLAGAKKFIRPNAYMLIHELRSGVWGKMSSIEEEVENLKKVMEHIYDFYISNTKMSKKQLEKILNKDVIWNATECISKGVADEIYTKC